jgi:hypothetical protein
MPGLGFGGMGAAAGAGDAISQLFDQRLKAAQLSQQDALTRLKIQELADAHEETLRSRQQAEADRAQALAEREHARKLSEAQSNYKLLGPTTPIGQDTMQSMVGAGLPKEAFQPKPITPAAPPASIAAPGQEAPAPDPGTVANSPAPSQQLFTRIPTAQEQQQQREDAAYQQLASLFPIGSRERTVLDYEHATGKNAPASLVGNPNEPLEEINNNGVSKLVPRSQAIGKAKFHEPQQTPVIEIHTVDANGNPITKVVPKAEAVGKDFAAAPSGQAATKAADRQHAIASLDQLDKAIEAAKDLIGPGAGRISSIEQTIGNPDPKIATLGTKLLLAKMQVDAGIGGARAAASPQLLARWDNLLTQKLTPEALHASVQAMRDILQAGQAPTSGGTKLSAEELIKKYGGGQ